MTSSAHELDLDLALRALADGNRRAILSAVRQQPRPVRERAPRRGHTPQTAAHHQPVMRGAGLVTEHREGARHLFAVDPAGFGVARDYLDEFWPRALAALRDAVEGDAAGIRG